ncbi:histidine kinase [Actinoplanes sp. NEAU-A12]|uniref:Histidine kinase n=1 Tax=Actinoplanes sandaracinus TaxID=3045177 RepID=A0ABT6WHR8_9ACTN|nr:histidine kinase [Actinoplanes sandaracinus]MDI6099268.1 histidine kinase [Actinoplanes sandaracinus]
MINLGQVVDDVIASVRAGEVRLNKTAAKLADQIGGSRARSRVHPIESLRASSVLFDIVLDTLADDAGIDGHRTVMVATRSLHSSIMRRIQWAAGSYVSFLLEQVHEAQLEERRRLARDLHDRVGSPASVVSRNLELAQAYQAGDPMRSQAKVAAAYEASVQTLQEIRDVAADMRLEDEITNLEKSLRVFLEQMADSDVVVHLTVSGGEDWVPANVLDEVFSVVREALRNAFEHAAPTTVVSEIDIAPHEIRARISDDGRGFDTGDGRKPREGLSSMRERAGLLGGWLSVSSVPGEGTHVEVMVSLQRTLR